MRSVELFAGAGGLAIGMANAGFRHAAVIEQDHDACETFRENQRHHAHAVEGWSLYEGDARRFDYSIITDEIMVVSGGPPCQPFSLGGKHGGRQDNREMFPEAVRAVRELRPCAFVFENVRGLLRDAFATYFSYIMLQLQYPELVRIKGETWSRHHRRLEEHHTSNVRASSYNVVFNVLNAANYGVPQKRERVFIVGFRSDLGVKWSFPEPTHSEDALVQAKWITDEYWDRHKISRKQCGEIPNRSLRSIARLKESPLPKGRLPWVTVRDSIADLPDPERSPKNGIPNHVFVPGARIYTGHTGSRLDEPAKTLKAGDHGVPGGENMLVNEDGSVRYFTVREAARLQTFPNEYEFQGCWTGTMRQLGNAVPVRLAEVVARTIATSLALALNPVADPRRRRTSQ